MTTLGRLTTMRCAIATLLLALIPPIAHAKLPPTVIHVDFRNMTDRYAYVIYADYTGQRRPTGTSEDICIPPHHSVQRTYTHDFQAADDPWVGLTAGTMTHDCKDGGITTFSSRHFITKGRPNDFISDIFENHIGLSLDPQKLRP